MDAKAMVGEMVEKARVAQKIYESYNQEQVDRLVKIIAKTVFDHAEELAKMAHEETQMGRYEHKIKKNQGKARIIWHSLKGKKSVGIIEEDEAQGIIKVAKPKGVVGAITPCTNPIVTPMCNAMFALKGRNAIIIAPHPRAKKANAYTIELINKNLRAAGAPDNLIQTIIDPSVELSNELMRQADVVVATGGMGMVKAAYSSGKPAFGVGAGNVQCIVDRNVDIPEAVGKMIAGRAFDNGIICSGEQMAIVPEEQLDAFVAEFQRQGAYYISEPTMVETLRKVLFDENGVMRKEIVGKSAQIVGAQLGLTLPENIEVILVKVDVSGTGDVLCREKMCPVIGIKTYGLFEEAVQIAQDNLEVEGKGHSVAIHSHNNEHLAYAGERLTVSRLLVNQICATMNGGSFQNALAPTTTLGCGSWGNNSISENLDYTHLINISRIAKVIEGAGQPSDDEIWSD